MSALEDREVQLYLENLRSALKGLPADERDEIVQEISAHIRDRAESSDLSLPAVLSALGKPEEIAIQYREDAILDHARASISPVRLLYALWIFARRGVWGVFALFFAVFGYLASAGLIITALVKLVFPAHVGFWLGANRFLLGFTSSPPPHATEKLGAWYTPVAGITGFLLLSLTILGSRALLGHMHKWRSGNFKSEGTVPVPSHENQQ
jgi:uncharacterized membrane protein